MKKPTEVSLTPNPTMAETLYAQRLAAGQAPMPEDGDPAFTPGVRKALAAATEQRNQNAVLAQVSDRAADGRDLINQMLGQVQALSAASQLLRTFGVSKLAHVKETKAYKNITGKFPNGSEFCGTWAGFCGLLGLSVDKVDSDIANLRAFGEEALESMSRMGIGYRDMAQYRRLPADAQGALIEAAKAGDKETLMDLAEQLIARQAGEKAVLNGEIEEKEKQIERHRKAYADLETQLEIRGRELQKLSRIDPASLLTRSVRAEAVANASAMGELCENLIRLGVAVNDESIAAEQRSLRKRAVGLAAGAALAHLQALYEALQADLGDELPLSPSVLDDLTFEEKSLAAKCLGHMQVQFSLRGAQRREEAYAEHLADGGKKKLGRPAKKQGDQ